MGPNKFFLFLLLKAYAQDTVKMLAVDVACWFVQPAETAPGLLQNVNPALKTQQQGEG